MPPEQKARVSIDALLVAAGWHVCNVSDANIHASTGVAIREFPLNSGFGFADYLLYVNGKACGVIEAKKQGATLTGVELQSGRYAQGLPTALPAWRRPLPFVWESTGIETHFTNGLDPEPRARAVFAFFRPELLVQWLAYLPSPVDGTAAQETAGTFLHRMRSMPTLVTEWGSGGAHYALWPAQISAITNLEKSLAANKPKSLIQMATGSGKTFTSIGFIYRLIKFGGARRVLFLVDRGNLARQTKKEFDAYASPYNNYKFGEEYIVQHLQGNQLDTSARVVKGMNALLMKEGAQDFRSGQKFDHTVFFGENVDIHHIFPQDWCKKQGIKPAVFDSIINKTPLSFRTNRIIGGVAPSQYLAKLMKGDKTTPAIESQKLDAYLDTHLITPALAHSDDFEAFMMDRQRRLLALIEQATGKAAYAGEGEEEGVDAEDDEGAIEADMTQAG